MIREAGLTVKEQQSAPIEFRFSNVDQFWQVVGSSGNTKRMMRTVGKEKIKKAALTAVEQFIQPSGGDNAEFVRIPEGSSVDR